MDSDEIMSDLAGPANVTSEDNSETKQGGAAAWNTKKFREEYEHQKNRLQDQDFSVGESWHVITMATQRKKLKKKKKIHWAITMLTAPPQLKLTTLTRLHLGLPITRSSTPRAPALNWSASCRS